MQNAPNAPTSSAHDRAMAKVSGEMAERCQAALGEGELVTGAAGGCEGPNPTHRAFCALPALLGFFAYPVAGPIGVVVVAVVIAAACLWASSFVWPARIIASTDQGLALFSGGRAETLTLLGRSVDQVGEPKGSWLAMQFGDHSAWIPKRGVMLLGRPTAGAESALAEPLG